MRKTVLNKSTWKRWLRVAKEVKFAGDAQEWWREGLGQLLLGGMSAATWTRVQEVDTRGAPGYGLLDEYCMEGPSAHRSAWHRHQLRALFNAWVETGPVERVVSGEGEAALRLWADGGRQGPWRWAKSNTGTVSAEEWEAMVSEMRERQQQVIEAIKAEREDARQRAVKLRDRERREKVDEQARRAEARLQASADRKR